MSPRSRTKHTTIQKPTPPSPLPCSLPWSTPCSSHVLLPEEDALGEVEGGALREVEGNIEGDLEDGALGLLMRQADADKLGDALGNTLCNTLDEVEGDALGEVE